MLDAERRTPGPNIDVLFAIPFLNNIEFFIVEVSGAPTCEDFEHFIGDRNKIAKHLKVMLKYIIQLRTDWRTYKPATLNYMDYKFIVSSIIRTQFLDSHAFLFRK